MRLPRFRIRTLMIAVAIVAAGIAVTVEISRRRDRFEALADDHFSKCVMVFDVSMTSEEIRRSLEEAERERPVRAWHAVLSDKYHYAAEHPWLPVWPDPPPPVSR